MYVKKNLIHVGLLRNMLTITPINENFQNLNSILVLTKK